MVFYADALGSGAHNLYKFTKIYSGGELDLEEARLDHQQTI